MPACWATSTRSRRSSPWRACRCDVGLRIVVVGRGFGVERLRRAQKEEGLASLVLIDWQPHGRLSWCVRSTPRRNASCTTQRARHYAESAFAIGPIADRFEAIIDAAQRSA